MARSEARLETILPEGPDRDRLRARLRPLLGLEAEEASREENFAAWTLFLESLAVAGPAVVVVEDLHWADEALLAFLDFLTGDPAPSRCSCSPPPAPRYSSSPAPAPASSPRPLASPSAPSPARRLRELARARLGAKSLPANLQALILERSGGNPLFAEELVRLLQDRGLVEERGGKVSLKAGADVPTPSSIGALIAARLDLLAPGGRPSSPTRPSSVAASGPAPSRRWGAAKPSRSSRGYTNWSPRSWSGLNAAHRSRARRSTASSTLWSVMLRTLSSRRLSGQPSMLPSPSGLRDGRRGAPRIWPRCSPSTTARRSSWRPHADSTLKTSSSSRRSVTWPWLGAAPHHSTPQLPLPTSREPSG